MDNSEFPYNAGDKVTDARYGFATVTFVGDERVGLRFESGGKDALIRMDQLNLSAGWNEEVIQVPCETEMPALLSWPASTFAVEDGSQEHFMYSHWDPFDPGAAEIILQRLSAIVPESKVLGGYGQFFNPPRPEPEEWRKGTHLVWPEQYRRMGMVLTLAMGEQSNELQAFYPYVDTGVEIELVLQKVVVRENGVEAQISALWGEAAIDFFDTAFLINRGWYESGSRYAFVLAGLAYSALPARAMDIPLPLAPEDIAWQRMLAAESGAEIPEIPDHISFDGAAIFLPVEGWDLDDYHFRGPVVKVEPFDDFLGQSGWRVRVTVMRFGDEEANLDVFITRLVWEGEEEPQAGQEIEGRLWLQGRLWNARLEEARS